MVRVLVALGVAVVVGAVAWPGVSVGLGWLVCALAAFGVAVAASRARARPKGAASAAEHAGTGPGEVGTDLVWRQGAGAAALVFAAVPAVRASGMLSLLCLLAAFVLAAYALLGGRSWASVLGGGALLLGGAGGGVAWLVGLGRRATGRPRRIALAAVVTVAVAVVLVVFLRATEPRVAEQVDSWTRGLPSPSDRSVFGALALATLGLGFAYHASRGPWGDWRVGSGDRPRTTLAWLAVAVVCLTSAGFVVTQVDALFGGHGYVLGPGGPDYADHARAGFHQVAAVSVVCFVVLAGLGALTRAEPQFAAPARITGCLLCGLIVVIAMSAIWRIALYVDVYGLTWPRLLMLAAAVFAAVVYALWPMALLAPRGDWMPRAVAATAVAILLALVAINPEAVMARTIIDARAGEPNDADLAYLDGLSADAIDELGRLPAGVGDCLLANLRADLAGAEPWYRANLARANARAILLADDPDSCGFATDRWMFIEIYPWPYPVDIPTRIHLVPR